MMMFSLRTLAPSYSRKDVRPNSSSPRLPCPLDLDAHPFRPLISSFRPLATSLPLPLVSALGCSPAVSARSATPSDLSRSSTLWSVNGVTDSALSRQRDLSQSPTSNVSIDSTLHTTARRHPHQILEYSACTSPRSPPTSAISLIFCPRTQLKPNVGQTERAPDHSSADTPPPARLRRMTVPSGGDCSQQGAARPLRPPKTRSWRPQ